MRVIIAGSREFDNYSLLKKECLNIFRQLKSEGYSTNRKDVEIISGTARGADKLGEKFAVMFQLGLKKMPAEWDLYGRSAGYKRNSEMAMYAKEDNELGVLIAFWNGNSRGTKHMIDFANKYNLRVFIIRI